MMDYQITHINRRAKGIFCSHTRKMTLLRNSLLSIDLNNAPPANIAQNYQSVREYLEKGWIVRIGGSLRVEKDIPNLSLSAAGVFVTGRPGSGWKVWRLENGTLVEDLRKHDISNARPANAIRLRSQTPTPKLELNKETSLETLAGIKKEFIQNPQDLAEVVAAYAEKHLDLEYAKLSNAYYYQSLPLCIIDAVFSLGVRYGQVENVIRNVAKVTDWNIFRPNGSNFLSACQQKKISDLINEINEHENPCQTLFNNRGYANPSAQNVPKVQKADLVHKFAGVLKRYQIETFQDLASYGDPDALDAELCALPALTSGVGVRYFRMLSGDENQVKPDRMIQRFIKDTIGKNLDVNTCVTLIQSACQMLKAKYSALTPRLLDHEIWKFQRKQKYAE
jgi:hypothetical protein